MSFPVLFLCLTVWAGPGRALLCSAGHTLLLAAGCGARAATGAAPVHPPPSFREKGLPFNLRGGSGLHAAPPAEKCRHLSIVGDGTVPDDQAQGEDHGFRL